MAEVLAESDPRLIEPRYFLDLFTSFFLQRSISCANSQSLSVLVDFSDLIAFNSALSFQLLHYPNFLLPLLEEAATKCLSNETPSDVVKIRLINLPPNSEISKLSVSDIINSSSSLIQLVGTVVRTGGVRMLELSKRYQCTKRSCQKEFLVFADPEQDFLLPRPTKCPAETLLPDGKIRRCNCTEFRELPNGKSCVDYQEIKVYDKIEHITLGSIPRSIVVLLTDALVDVVNPGDDVVIVGTTLQQWKPQARNFRCGIDIVVKASNIMRSVKKQRASELLSVFSHDDGGCFDKYWAGASLSDSGGLERRDKIIRSVCPDLYGMYSAKLALLLAIIGGAKSTSHDNEETRRTNIHLLFVGDPGNGKSQLLRFAAEAVERSVLTTGVGTTGAGLTCSAQRDAQSSSEWYLEAGALVLASGGICCIDEFGTMKEQDRVAIHEAMEQQTISVAKAGLIMKLDCKCSVVAASNLKGKFDASTDLSTNTGIAPPLLSRFDLVQVLVDKPDREWDKMVSTFILKGSTNQGSSTTHSQADHVPMEWLKKYIAHVQERFNPKLSKEAFQLLNAYYRQQRQQTRNSSSVRLMESLIRVSQAHARLMFREDVSELDAIVSIHLVSRSISSVSVFAEDVSVSQEVFPDSPADYFARIKEMVFNMLGYRSPHKLSFVADRSRQDSSHTKDDDDGIHRELQEDPQRAAGKASSPKTNEIPTVAPPHRRIVSHCQTSYGTSPVESLNIGEKRARMTLDDSDNSAKLARSSAAHPSVANVSFLAMVEDFDSGQED